MSLFFTITDFKQENVYLIASSDYETISIYKDFFKQ